MMEHITTPFGRRAMSLGMAAAQVAARDVEGKMAHKWKTFRAVTESREALGVSDRSLVVLNALLTFLPETAMSAGDLVVFPSNQALSLRSHGMAETTLRRHVASLVDAGLVIRRDSPNGKRYARRGEQGIEQAYGFDLSPLLARSEEFDRLAAAAAAAARSAAMARERVTIYRRDIGKMLEAGSATGAGEAWRTFREAYAGLCYRLPRKVTMESVAPLVADLHVLAVKVGEALQALLPNQELSGSDTQNGEQIENSKPDTPIVLEPAIEEQQGEGQRPLPLSLVLKACPDVAMYDKGGIKSWRDLITTTSVVRGMLGISASAWEDAQATMGEAGAAVVVAGILQRAEAIKNPGGYLRSLTERSRAGGFSAWPMVLALMRSQAPSGRSGRVAGARPG